MMTAHRLEKELETYEAHRQELLAESEGKFVLIQDSKVIGVWDTYEDALKSGYDHFGIDTPFLVKQLSGIEGIQFFTRDLISCRS